MTQTMFQQTVAAIALESAPGVNQDTVCLLQIHPLAIDAGPVAINEFPFVIGRDASCNLTIHDTSISRRHSVIERTDTGFTLRDLGSTNGTYVGDQEVTQHALVAGDQIRLGNRIFKLLTSNHFESQYHEAVYSMMTRDGLTGVWNKRYFTESLERDLKRSQRNGRAISLAIMDIDFFKQVNDTHGHLAGDEVLIELGERIQAELRGDEIFARFGGEEFAIILNEMQLEDAIRAAERCRIAIQSRPFQTSAGPLDITISVGVAVSSDESQLATEFIQNADAALYEAKHDGRNRVSYHRPV
ncbi:Response regulator PleD [Rubripirellula lacrimiformis]|uniref:diguanylate cyclase n=1 Tax=Rubripirellula lacrimiformis TaxID=1930273 RepID=A0A517NAD5_9BACT|nr:GGDEF domain-containing protein [Rubripirellula lacrimiformis]QDT03978.1 Response regulator PleD [Rubripirellula lacrimiformis]